MSEWTLLLLLGRCGARTARLNLWAVNMITNYLPSLPMCSRGKRTVWAGEPAEETEGEDKAWRSCSLHRDSPSHLLFFCLKTRSQRPLSRPLWRVWGLFPIISCICDVFLFRKGEGEASKSGYLLNTFIITPRSEHIFIYFLTMLNRLWVTVNGNSMKLRTQFWNLIFNVFFFCQGLCRNL